MSEQTKVQTSTNAEETTSSQPIAKPNVARRPSLSYESVIAQVALSLMTYQAIKLDKLKSHCYAVLLSHTDYSMSNPHEQLEKWFSHALAVLHENFVITDFINDWVYQTNSIKMVHTHPMNFEQLSVYIKSNGQQVRS